MTVAGSNSVTADDLIFEASPVAPEQLARLLMGSETTSVFLRDGLRCVGGSLFAYQLIRSDAAGILREGPGLVGFSGGFGSAGTILPGSTWTFQMWFVDDGPCGNGTNLSNSMQVTFAP